VAYVPPTGREPRALSALGNLLIAAQEPARKKGGGPGITLVVEEMNLSFPLHGGATKAPGFAHICSRGRHYGIEVIGASQRIAEVSTRFRGNCTETVVLAQKGPRDLDAAAAELGCDKARVSALENLDYLQEKAGQITPGKVAVPRAKKK
jgi:DNA helicase HerA-like ATPase